ncbi:hypothetical protein N7495_004536 [Penicillium taxi]|uniref:uncharacterized protein n=1 Tax=Penicillium taxi TaxID=168475 RepID=UPI00254533D0|nr:uncharacterized protein N7495_004536 [Penicillium taxi]KAJ5899792.1 hypothetical protein N7495_004536 [Penicillium taxi]
MSIPRQYSPSQSNTPPQQLQSNNFDLLVPTAPQYQSIGITNSIQSMAGTQHEFSNSHRPQGVNNMGSTSNLRSSVPPSLSVPMVVIRNSGMNNTSAGNAVESNRNQNPHCETEVLTDRDIFYMPVGAQASRQDILATDAYTSVREMRGMKREHHDGEESQGARKHSKRLTTKEEISLFEICNNHAGGFGKRSDICNWWKNIAEQFALVNGRPYSWHSVRRKVEMATKQRVKFLEEQQQRQHGLSPDIPAKDIMNPQWVAVLDTWIPTWQRWLEAETRRIAKRDEMLRRRSVPKPAGGLWKAYDPAVHVGMNSPGSPALPKENTTSAAQMTTYSVTTPVASANTLSKPSTSFSSGVKLPPGFETMFSNFTQPTRQPAPYIPLPLSEALGSGSGSASGSGSLDPTPPPDTHPITAIDTIGKLKEHHFDTPSGDSSDPRSSPVISALIQASEPAETESSRQAIQYEPAASYNLNSADLYRMKEELRKEIKAELRQELYDGRGALEEKLDSVQRTQDMILDMLRQEPT